MSVTYGIIRHHGHQHCKTLNRSTIIVAIIILQGHAKKDPADLFFPGFDFASLVKAHLTCQSIFLGRKGTSPEHVQGGPI